MKKNIPSLLLALTWLATTPTNLIAQGTAFTYQGRLNTDGISASGLYDFRFKLYADPLGTTQVGASYLTNAIPANNGLFVATVDFGAGIFTGGTNWLEVDVRTNGAASYTVLSPLQGVTPTPNAIFAMTAGNVSGLVSAAQITGTIGNAVLPASPNFSGTITANQISGNGGNVTNVNAALLNGKTATNFWQTGGNAGTSPTNGNFLGTTDNQPLEVWVNNGRAWRLESGPSGEGAPNVIGGSQVNFVVPGVAGAVIGGGGATDYFGPVYINSVAADFGTIGGGINNQVQAVSVQSTIGGGERNLIHINSALATIAGGYDNQIQPNALESTIGGGGVNTVATNAQYATIPGGDRNVAGGNYSFAAGQQAQALHQGAFVWADSQNATFSSLTNDQFLIRAQGGVGINTNNPAGAALSVNGSITAPMWKATNVINSAGPLILTKSFTTSGGTLVIAASGTGYSTTVGATIGMDIKLDGTTIDSCLIYANPATTHLAFLPKTIVKTGVAAGSHTLVLAPHGSTTSDATDNFCVTVQELPF